MSRLELLKASKVKELVLKRRLELEEISRKAHMVTEALAKTKYSTEAVTSGKCLSKFTIQKNGMSAVNIIIPREL